MNKKVIVLWGNGGIGKTTTLNLLIEKLSKIGTMIDGKIAKKPTDNTWAVFDYNGKRVAVITVGDDYAILDKYFKKIKTDCDIYVCASRSKGSSVDYIRNRFANGYIMWQRKWNISEEHGKLNSFSNLIDLLNEKQVEGLIETINLM